MTDFFLTLLNMSLVSCWLILALLILRPLLKKAPKAFMCALWGLVGLRLVCPFTFESILSLIPTSKPISKEAILTESQLLGEEGITFTDTTTIISNTLASPAGASINPLQAISLVAAFIWAVGLAVMLIISLVSYLRLRKSVSASVSIGGNVFINDDIASPFVLGLIKPRIYIPSSLSEYEKEYVIAHENAHIKRCDYLLKPLGYIILSLHWFNPLVWVAYILLCRDIESACDERVIRKMSDQSKKEYSEVLLRLSMPSKKVRACPVAFGEVGVKGRIKSVLNYKKPAFWICIVAVVLTCALTVGFLTNPVSKKGENTEVASYTLEECISKAIVDVNRTLEADSRFCVENYVELKSLTFGDNVTAYIWAYYGEYEQTEEGVSLVCESYKPAKVRLKKVNESYTLLEYLTTPDRRETDWVLVNFPSELHDSAIYIPGYYNDQKTAALDIAKAHFGVNDSSNEFFPVFNAEVLEISESHITVAPLKGETVSKNTFDKVRLSTRHLTSTSYNPSVGDMVRVRYVDIITLDTDPPTLVKVFNLELLEKNSMFTMLYSGGDTAYYLSKPSQDKVYVYNQEDTETWFPDTYFTLNEELGDFALVFRSESDFYTFQSPYESVISINDSGSVSFINVITGNYSLHDDLLMLYTSEPEIGDFCFNKEGDSYVFSQKKTDEINSLDLIANGGGQKIRIFNDGDTFTLGQGISP